jgi:hypothetical protein
LGGCSTLAWPIFYFPDLVFFVRKTFNSNGKSMLLIKIFAIAGLEVKAVAANL